MITPALEAFKPPFTSSLLAGDFLTQIYDAPEDTGQTAPRNYPPKRQKVLALLALPLITAGHCDGRMDDIHSPVQGQAAHPVEKSVQPPAGGTACSITGLSLHDFDCGSGVKGGFSTTSRSLHYHVNRDGERITSADVDLPANEAVNLGGMCLRISVASEDAEPHLILSLSHC